MIFGFTLTDDLVVWGGVTGSGEQRLKAVASAWKRQLKQAVNIIIKGNNVDHYIFSSLQIVVFLFYIYCY